MSLQTSKSIDHPRTLTSTNFYDSTVFLGTREIFFGYMYFENIADYTDTSILCIFCQISMNNFYSVLKRQLNE